VIFLRSEPVLITWRLKLWRNRSSGAILSWRSSTNDRSRADCARRASTHLSDACLH